MTSTRETLFLEAFTTLSEALVDDYDVVELLQTLVEQCAYALDVAAAGLLLADDDETLEVVASTSDDAELVDLIEAGGVDGHVRHSYTTASIVATAASDLDTDAGLVDELVAYARRAAEHGYHSVCAIPLRLHSTAIGSLGLFASADERLSESDTRAAQALADLATVGIVHERAMRAEHAVRDQLERALASRVVIEQAKGIVAYTKDVSMDAAFTLIRSHARAQRIPLVEVATHLVERRLQL